MRRGHADARDPAAFTIIELLVVIAVIAILASLLLPALSTVREAGRCSFCINNLKQIGIGLRLYTHRNSGFFPVIHGDDYGTPVPATQEWWEMLLPFGFERRFMLCLNDPLSNDPDMESYILNGMFAFTKKINAVRNQSGKIIVSERADSGEALNHQGYPAWKALSEWQDFIKHDRHADRSNYLYVDGHVETKEFADTIGEEDGNEHRNDTNEHYLPEFCPP